MKRILVCGLVPDIGGLEKIVVDFYNHIDTSEFELEFYYKVLKMLNLVNILKSFATILSSFIESLS